MGSEHTLLANACEFGNLQKNSVGGRELLVYWLDYSIGRNSLSTHTCCLLFYTETGDENSAFTETSTHHRFRAPSSRPKSS